VNLILERDLDDGVCTLGRLFVDGNHWYTIERPWIPDPLHVGGLAGRSCVPVGVYELVLHDSEAHPETWALVNAVLGVTHYGPSARSAVLIHPANHAYELRGCIAPGMELAHQSVLRSRQAFAQLKAALPWTIGHILEIRGPA
jgi:hypothetical protein